ncbi:MAG: hypothetical protein JSU97_07520 [Dehalococcoidia bacterium]|nr:MAG: hypothetical protein JSU97_07520 [Dehalococcoidia bacterium]
MLLISRREPPDAEDLRCEYAAAEVHVANLTSGVWQSAAIVVGGSIAALAVLIGVEFTHAVAGGVTVLAVGAVLVIEMWRHNWRRHKLAIDNCWVRMRQIESARGMQRNIFLYLLTKAGTKDKDERANVGKALRKLDDALGKVAEWRTLLKADRKRLAEKYEKFPKPPRVLAWFSLHKFKGTGQDVLHGTACLVEVGWLLMIVIAWSEELRC